MAGEGTGSIGNPGMESPEWAQHSVNSPYGSKAVPKAKPSKSANALRMAAQKAVAMQQRGRMKKALKDRAKPLGGDHYGGAL